MDRPVRRMLFGDRREAAGVVAGGEFSGEAAGGDGQDGAGHVQVGAEVGDGELEGGDGDAAGSGMIGRMRYLTIRALLIGA